jgi:hypothetical protein
MPQLMSLPRLLATSLTVSLLVPVASAQQAPTVRIRGTIETVDGSILGITASMSAATV